MALSKGKQGRGTEPIRLLHPQPSCPQGVPLRDQLRCCLIQVLPGSTQLLCACVTTLELCPSAGRAHTPFTLLWATSPQSRRDHACRLALAPLGYSIPGRAAYRGAPRPRVCRGLAGAG